jgi:hypothetical protein
MSHLVLRFKLLKCINKIILLLRTVTLCYGNCYGPSAGVTPVTLPLGVLRCYALGAVTHFGGSR